MPPKKKKKKTYIDPATRASNARVIREIEAEERSSGGNTGQGGDRSRTGLVHGTDAQGNDVTASFGRSGTSKVSDTLLSDGHKDASDFYGTKGGKGHDHYDGKGGGTQRDQYTGEGFIVGRVKDLSYVFKLAQKQVII